VGRAHECGRVVDVEIGRADVEVARDDERLAAQLADPLRRGLEEAQLVLVEGRPDRAPVGHVDGRGPQAARAGLDPARLVDGGLAGQPDTDVGQLDPVASGQGHPAPAPGAVMHGPVAGGVQLELGKGAGLRLRLLQEQQVR
jgi:hypothetical protein